MKNLYGDRSVVKVLHVLETSLPNLVGYSIRAKYIVENQKKYGMQPIVVTSPFFKNEDSGMRKEIINGISYYRTNFIKTPNEMRNKLQAYFTRYKMLQNYKKAVLKIAEDEKPDIIHAHSSYTNGYAANFAARIMKIPSIYELRSLWGESAVVEDGLRQNSLKHRLVWHFELQAMKKANRVIAISQGIKDEIVKRGIYSDKIDILPNGVDSGIFVPMDKAPDVIEKYKLNNSSVIGYIGSIRKLEGLSYLIDAFRIIKEQNKKVKLIVVGDGPEKENLKSQTERLNLEDIIFTGKIFHENILGFYSVIDLFIFPRIDAKINRTVTPLKPLEAMAAGKVCLCSNVAGLTEFIKDDYNGVIFESEDAEDLADKVLNILADPERYDRIKANGLAWVRKERDWKVLIPRYNEIYKKTLDSKQV